MSDLPWPQPVEGTSSPGSQAEHGHGDGHGHGHGAGVGSAAGPVADASVRLARPSDAPAVGVVQAAVWVGTYAALVPEAVLAEFKPPAFASAWRTSLESPPSTAHRLLVACAGEQVVGMTAVAPSQDPDAGAADSEVTVLGVHPGARRAGHGSRLLNAAVDTARGAGAATVRVWVPERGTQLVTFLVASGFEADGAYRERGVGPAPDDVVREVRLVADVA